MAGVRAGCLPSTANAYLDVDHLRRDAGIHCQRRHAAALRAGVGVRHTVRREVVMFSFVMRPAVAAW